MGKKRQGLPHRLLSPGTILPYHDVAPFLSPQRMHKGELRYGKAMSDLFPIGQGIDFSLDGPYEPHGNDVGQAFIFEGLNELFQIEPAIGDDTRHLDAVSNTPIGITEEGKDVIPRSHITRPVPQMNHVFAFIEKGKQRIMTWPAVLDRVVSLLCSLLLSIPQKYRRVEGKPVFFDAMPGDKLAEI